MFPGELPKYFFYKNIQFYVLVLEEEVYLSLVFLRLSSYAEINSSRFTLFNLQKQLFRACLQRWVQACKIQDSAIKKT